MPDEELTMATPKNSEDDHPDDPPEDDEDADEVPAGARCAICEMLAGECDHLVASIDLTYSEIVAGAIFARERVTLDLMEHLAISDPDALKAAGAGPMLEHVATLVRAETDEGASTGDALAAYYPQLIAALSHLLQEDEDVTSTGVDAASGDDSSVEYLWGQEPERSVNSLIERLEALVAEVDE